MKKLMLFSVALTIVASLFSGCSKDSVTSSSAFPNALVTVKSAEDGTCYFQLDNSTTIIPTNLSSNPFKKQVRALTYLSNVSSMVGPYTKSAEVAWIDSILTKSSVPMPTGSLEWGFGYGKDPVDVLNSWMTVLEDDYLTLAFRAYYNVPGNVHYMNLVYGSNPDDPYEVVFTHNAGEGSASSFMYYFDGIVAFDLRQIPGLTSEKSAVVTVKYNSGVHGEEHTLSFSYPGNGTTSITPDNSGPYAQTSEMVR